MSGVTPGTGGTHQMQGVLGCGWGGRSAVYVGHGVWPEGEVCGECEGVHRLEHDIHLHETGAGLVTVDCL